MISDARLKNAIHRQQMINPRTLDSLSFTKSHLLTSQRPSSSQRYRTPKCLTSSRKVQINNRENICASIFVDEIYIKYVAVIGHILQEIDNVLECPLVDKHVVGELDIGNGVVYEDEYGVQDGFIV
jgi:hypothetical protein